MLPAANRLRTAADFRHTTRRGAKASRGCVVVYVCGPSDTVDPSASVRVGVVVSKSVGGSVERHRAARRIRHAIRPWLGQLPAGTDVVVRALPGADRDHSLTQDLSTSLTSARGRA